MATSTSTLLEVCNDVLLGVNERPLANLSSTIGLQVKAAVRQALRTICLDGTWNWLEDRVNASSWTGNTATLPTTVVRVHDVSILQSNRYLTIPYVQTRNEFEENVVYSYSDTTTRPFAWYADEPNIIRVNPYPTTVAAQNLIFFNVINYTDIPSGDSGLFAIPETFIPALTVRAKAEFSLSRSEDLNLFSTYMGLYEKELTQLRANTRTPKINNRYGRNPNYR